MNSVKILNVEIDNLSITEFLGTLEEGFVVTPNVDHLVKLQKDPAFAEVYQAADYRVCDSKVLMYAAKFLGTPIQEKISGSDLFPAFYNFHRHNEDIRIFLLGARDGVAAEAARKINDAVGRPIIVDYYSPSFGFEKNEHECALILEKVRKSGATVLAVGVGAPKQEKFIHKYRDRLPEVKIFLAIGATIDFEAGNVSRSPKWISEVGLEWLYRLMSEPKRLWRRYLVEDPFFFWLLLMQRLNLYREPFRTKANVFSLPERYIPEVKALPAE